MDFDEETLNARWVVDSETGEQYLLNLKTGYVIATKTKQGEWVNPENSSL